MPCGGCSTNKQRVEHFRPRRKEIIPSEQKCDLCGEVSWDVAYCSFCKKWLCPKCAKDPLKRFRGFLKEQKKKISRH